MCQPQCSHTAKNGPDSLARSVANHAPDPRAHAHARASLDKCLDAVARRNHVQPTCPHSSCLLRTYRAGQGRAVVSVGAGCVAFSSLSLQSCAPARHSRTHARRRTAARTSSHHGHKNSSTPAHGVVNPLRASSFVSAPCTRMPSPALCKDKGALPPPIQWLPRHCKPARRLLAARSTARAVLACRCTATSRSGVGL